MLLPLHKVSRSPVSITTYIQTIHMHVHAIYVGAQSSLGTARAAWKAMAKEEIALTAVERLQVSKKDDAGLSAAMKHRTKSPAYNPRLLQEDDTLALSSNTTVFARATETNQKDLLDLLLAAEQHYDAL